MRMKSVWTAATVTLLLFSFLLATALPIQAKSLKPIPDVTNANAVYLYNFECDRVILNKNVSNRIAPASTVKMASGFLFIELLSNRLDEVVTLRANMLTERSGATLGLQVGDRLSIRDLLYASICGGYNDATGALAVLCCGSSEDFVTRLNARLEEFGCTDTHYTNPTGMDEEGMYTTILDVAKISKQAIESPLYMTVSSAISYSFSLVRNGTDKTTLVYNRNALISPYYYQGCQSKYAKGLIAGMTDRGGQCVASYAEYAGSRYLCIVMGANGTTQGIQNSFSIAYHLLQYAYLNCVYVPVATAGESMCQTPVRLALPKDKEGVATVPCVLENDLYALLPDDTTAKDLTFRSYLHAEALKAPVSAGDVVGGTDVYYGDTWLCHARLLAAEDVEVNTMLFGMNRIRSFLFSRRTVIAFTVFIILLSIYLFCLHRRKKEPIMLDFRTQSHKKPPRPPMR